MKNYVKTRNFILNIQKERNYLKKDKRSVDDERKTNRHQMDNH